MIHTTMIKAAGACALTVLMLASCGGDPNSPGIEYMPDMYRSPSMEAYVDYGQDPYYFGDSLAKAQRLRPSARKPVPGTISFSMQAEKAMFAFPYDLKNTPEDYEKAGVELKSPIPMTEETVAQGKIIYDKFCTHCHGKKGMGDGPVVKNGKYPPPPAYNGAQLAALSEGKMYHSLMHGKNIAMGSHAGQINAEERWTVIQYVKYLQAGEKMPGAASPAVTDSAATTQQ